MIQVNQSYSYGLGAALSHITEDGERPIAYASRSLSQSEQNYAMIEKEAPTIIFGIKKFHQYLFGRRSTLITDHRLLTLLLGPKSGIPVLGASRLQRWANQLSAYQYDVEYRASQSHFTPMRYLVFRESPWKKRKIGLARLIK